MLRMSLFLALVVGCAASGCQSCPEQVQTDHKLALTVRETESEESAADSAHLVCDAALIETTRVTRGCPDERRVTQETRETVSLPRAVPTGEDRTISVSIRRDDNERRALVMADEGLEMRQVPGSALYLGAQITSYDADSAEGTMTLEFASQEDGELEAYAEERRISFTAGRRQVLQLRTPEEDESGGGRQSD